MTDKPKKLGMRTSGAASNRSLDVAAADSFVNAAGQKPDTAAEIECRPVTTRIAADLEEKLRLAAFQRRTSVAKIARELLEEAIREKL
jgi:hypothetical protein